MSWIYWEVIGEVETVWAVGYMDQEGTLLRVSGYDAEWKAARRVHYLNGGDSDDQGA